MAQQINGASVSKIEIAREIEGIGECESSIKTAAKANEK